MRKVKVYPSQIRKGDVITLTDYTGLHRGPVVTKVEVTGEPQEGRRGHFTGHRSIEVPVPAIHATMWQHSMSFTASRRVEVERT